MLRLLGPSTDGSKFSYPKPFVPQPTHPSLVLEKASRGPRGTVVAVALGHRRCGSHTFVSVVLRVLGGGGREGMIVLAPRASVRAVERREGARLRRGSRVASTQAYRGRPR